MESTSVFNLYAHDSASRLQAANVWAQQLRDKVNGLNSSAERMAVLFDPVVRTVARSFFFAGELDSELKADIMIYDSGEYPRFTVSRAFETVALDICKEIISQNDIIAAAESIQRSPEQTIKLLNDAYPQAA